MTQTIREGRIGDSVTPVSSRQLPVHTFAICLILACYACGRVLQVVHGPPAIIVLVAMEVFSAFALALVDGARAWGMRGILVFAAICTVVGNVVENIGVATGFRSDATTSLKSWAHGFMRFRCCLGWHTSAWPTHHGR